MKYINSSNAEVFDATDYINSDNLLAPISSEPNYELVKHIVQIGKKHANKKLFYLDEIAEYVESWETKIYNSENSTKTYGLRLTETAYNTIIKGVNNRLEKERDIAFMKSMLPVSYVVFGGVFLFFAVFFTTMFYYATKTGIFILTRWLNLSLCVAFWGLTITVIVAMFEWRKRINDWEEKTGQQSSR